MRPGNLRFKRHWAVTKAFRIWWLRAGVWRVVQHSKHHLDRVRWLSLPVAEHIPRLIMQHQAIVDAVGQRDPDIAEASLRVHLREVYATIERLDLKGIAEE